MLSPERMDLSVFDRFTLEVINTCQKIYSGNISHERSLLRFSLITLSNFLADLIDEIDELLLREVQAKVVPLKYEPDFMNNQNCRFKAKQISNSILEVRQLLLAA